MPTEEIESQLLNEQGACDLCRDIQRDDTGELAELHDVRNHTHCGACSPALLASETKGRASCSFDGSWRWELPAVTVNTGPHLTTAPGRVDADALQAPAIPMITGLGPLVSLVSRIA